MWGWFGIALPSVVVCVTLIVRSLSAASVTHFVKADVGFGWGVALFVVALVPADVVLTMANEDSRALLNLYAIPYWATQILTWLVLPLHQLYADAGDFTVRARLRTSVRENGLFYVVLGILGLVVMIVLVITKGISVGGIVSGAVAFSLSFSIATGVFLMGYGFSEIPRVCWLRSSLSGRKRWCEHRVGQLSDKLEAEYTELSKLVWSAEQMSNTMPRRHHLRWAMDVIDESIKKSAVPGAPPDAENKDEDDYDYEDIHALAALRRRLNRAIGSFDRVKHEYLHALRSAVEVEDIELSCAAGRSSGDHVFRSTLRPPRTGTYAKLKDKAEYWWKCIARRYIMRFFAVVLALLSFFLVLAEITIWLVHVPKLKDKDCSIISLLITSFHGVDFPVKVVVGLSLVYMLACAYFTVLKLAMFSFFHVVPHHTDAPSLLLSASLFCRYSAPICYNFLSLLPVVHRGGKESVFEQAMGQHLPNVAIMFNDIFPVVLGIFCPMVTFGVLDRLKACCGGSRFRITDEGVTDELTAKGRAILEQEKESFKTGKALGATHSAITIRPRAPVKKFGLELNRFFGRGNKAGDSAEAAAKAEQHTALLTEERVEERPAAPPAPAMTRAEELRARLASKAEAVRGGDGKKSSWPSFGGASSSATPSSAAAPSAPTAAAPPPPPPRAAPPAAPRAPAAAPSAAGGDSLDALFANLGKH